MGARGVVTEGSGARRWSCVLALTYLTLALAACSVGYWDQRPEFGDRPMYHLDGEGVHGHISRALHEKFVSLGLEDKEGELIGKITRESLNSTFFFADVGEAGVDPQALREGNVPGWVFGTPEPLGVGQTKVEVSCRRVESVPEWLRP